MPRAAASDPDARHDADVLHRGDAGVPAQPLEHPRRRRAGAANALYRGGLRIHTTLDPDPAGARPRRHALSSRRTRPGIRRGDRVARHQDRRDPGDGRRQRLRAGRERDQHGAWCRARPARASSSSSSPRRSRPVRSRTTSIDGTAPCTLPNPGDPKDPFVINDGVVEPASVARCETTWSSINCAFARLSQIVGLNRVVDTTYRMAHSPYLSAGRRRRSAADRAVRQLRDRRQRDEPARHGGRRIQTIANHGLHHDPYYVECIDGADGTRVYTHETRAPGARRAAPPH